MKILNSTLLIIALIGATAPRGFAEVSREESLGTITINNQTGGDLTWNPPASFTPCPFGPVGKNETHTFGLPHELPDNRCSFGFSNGANSLFGGISALPNQPLDIIIHGIGLEGSVNGTTVTITK